MRSRRVLLLMGFGPLSAACGFVEQGAPRVIAHRAAAGNWPQDSRTGVQGSVEAGYPGIEIDIAITRDEVPILSHEPWVNTVTCATVDGEPVVERMLISDFTFEELNERFRCGGIADPNHPDAEVVADTYLSLDELLTIVESVPDMLVYLDTKYDPPYTQGPEVFAEQIISRLDAAQLSNPFVIESTLPEGIAALKNRGDYPVSLGWPRYTADDEDGIVTTLGAELSSTVGTESGVGEALSAGANAITSPYQIADRQQARWAHESGLQVFLFTLNEETTLGRFCSWTADYLMTDYPERAECLSR